MGEKSVFSSEQLDMLQEQLEAMRRQLVGTNPELLREIYLPEEPVDEQEAILNGSRARIEEDCMTAWLYLYPPREGQIYSQKDITDYLSSKGVVCGLHISNIKAMIHKKIYNREVKIAVGQLAGEGQDGYYDYLFAPVFHRAPAIREDGSVDYSSMSMLQNVKQGEKVAIYHAAEQGECGFKVTGEEMKARLVRELPPLRGKNITRLPDGLTYVSEIDGKVELYEGRLDVQKVHTIQGDVTLITGKIEFYGDVIINGNVETGVVIRAGRNIIITGTVEAVDMYAGGDIVLSKGIAGGKKAKLSARGNVFADFIENCSVTAGGDVQANIIMNSEVLADGKVVLTGRRGTIIGGYTHGLLGVEAVNIGNDVEVRTIVHSGYDSKTYRQYIGKSKKEQDIQTQLVHIVEEMTKILKSKRKNGNELEMGAEARLLELNHNKDECFAALESIKTDKEILKQNMENGQGAIIKVAGHIYRGTVVCIENAQFPIEHSTCFMKYSVQNGIINGQVIII